MPCAHRERRRCPAVLKRALPYSTAFRADYAREETQRSVGRLEKAIVEKLGWGQQALFFAGARQC